jgi:hypothetical protein
MRPLPARGSLALAMLVTALSLGGCSFFGSMRPPTPEVTAPDTTATPVGPAETPPGTPRPEGDAAPRKTVKSPPVAARSAAPDTAAVTAPERAPTVSIRLSAQDRAAREAQYRENVDRAVRALALIRGRAIGKTDQEELSAADQFLADARRAFEASDLTRACTVAEKARVLAEELRGRLAPP